MTAVLLDTNAYVRVGQGDERALAVIHNAQTVGLSTIVIGELLAGFSCGNRYHRNVAELDEFIALSRVAVLPIDRNTADIYGEIYAHLRRLGKPIPTNDLWLAAAAKQYEMAVFTYDRHFVPIADIRSGSTFEELGLA